MRLNSQNNLKLMTRNRASHGVSLAVLNLKLQYTVKNLYFFFFKESRLYIIVLFVQKPLCGFLILHSSFLTLLNDTILKTINRYERKHIMSFALWRDMWISTVDNSKHLYFHLV